MYRPSLDDRLISLPDKLCVRRGLKVMHVCEEEPAENWRGLSASREGKVDEYPFFGGYVKASSRSKFGRNSLV